MSISVDAFLGGRLRLMQPKTGFRAGIDAVLLAAACPASAGQSVLDLGCGVGTAGLCLASRVPVRLFGVEIQAEYAQLARENARENDIALQLWQADINHLPDDLRQQSFDHVIANPPYFDRAQGVAAADPGRDTALGGHTPLKVWLSVASKRLSPKGWLTMIQRIDRLPQMIRGLPPYMGSISVTPIAARHNRAPHLILLRARKNGRGLFQVHAPFVMHSGPAHLADADDFTEVAAQILREGATLPWG